MRNNIYKSNKTGIPRCIKIGGKSNTWKQFRSAFRWDQQSFSLPLHEKLTMQHLNLDSASIVRNKLAEDMIDAKMLFLMQVITLLLCMFDWMPLQLQGSLWNCYLGPSYISILSGMLVYNKNMTFYYSSLLVI